MVGCSRSPRFALALAVAAALVVQLRVAYASESQWETRFLDELVVSRATRWTPEFHAYRPDSYLVDKIALARKLPEHARRRGRNLHALIVVGPVGGLWTYYVIAVFREGSQLRVNEVVFPHARITAKHSGLIERAVFERAVRAVVDSGALIRVASPDELSSQLDARERIDARLVGGKPRRSLGDFRFDLLVCVYEGDAPSYWYGTLASRRETDIDAAVSGINALLQRTQRTYEHGQGTARQRIREASFASPFRGRIYAQGMLLHDPQPALGSALASFGYSTFDTTQPALGIGGGVAWMRGRLTLDLVIGLERPFFGPDGQAGAVAREAFMLTAGVDVWDQGQLTVYPFAGVAPTFLHVQLDPGSIGPFSGSASRSDDEQRYSVEQIAWLLGVGMEHVIPFAAGAERHRGGLEWGLRLGLIWGPDTSSWAYLGEDADDRKNVDGPIVNPTGVFGTVELGFGDLQ